MILIILIIITKLIIIMIKNDHFNTNNTKNDNNDIDKRNKNRLLAFGILICVNIFRKYSLIGKSSMKLNQSIMKNEVPCLFLMFLQKRIL